MTEIISPILCALITLRIATYRRSGARYRAQHSVTAYLLATSAGGLGLSMLFSEAMVDNFLMLLLSILCASLFAVRGNVAELFRRAA